MDLVLSATSVFVGQMCQAVLLKRNLIPFPKRLTRRWHRVGNQRWRCVSEGVYIRPDIPVSLTMEAEHSWWDAKLHLTSSSMKSFHCFSEAPPSTASALLTMHNKFLLNYTNPIDLHFRSLGFIISDYTRDIQIPSPLFYSGFSEV